ncbi:unnamed protein product [Sympodiomycopsis kandeliae]
MSSPGSPRGEGSSTSRMPSPPTSIPAPTPPPPPSPPAASSQQSVIAKANISTAESFLMGALAACTAVTVTNPFEVIKTRMQLYGELGSKGNYQSPFKVFSQTLKHEGVKGIQRGLGPAYTYQILLNGSRLGFYEPFRTTYNTLTGRSKEEVWAVGSLAAGASSGVVGAVLGNPFFLVKARLQAYSPQLNPDQARHHYTGTLNGLSSILKSEGLRGLTRGWDAAVLRTAMGSTVQLPAYNLAKTYLSNLKPENTFAYNPLLFLAGQPTSFWTYLTSSIFSGLCVCAVMQPADTALTRMYNQPVQMVDGKLKGTLYKGPLHCLYLTAKAEGPLAWYKGTTAHLARIAPHTVLTLVMNEAYLRWYAQAKVKGIEKKEAVTETKKMI